MLKQLNVAFWIARRFEQWFVNVLSFGCPIKTGNAVASFYHHHLDVKKTANALIMSHALIGNVAIHATVEFMQLATYKIIEPFVLVKLDLREIQIRYAVLLAVASIRNVIRAKHV